MFKQNSLIIDINAIRKNIISIKDLTKNKFFAVVKANAYGFGLIEVSKKIEDLVDMFCVATIDEAVQLRENGITKDILLLGYINSKDFEKLNRYDVVLSLYDFEMARKINALGKIVRVHIKIETGHNRLGFKNTSENIENIKEICGFENIKVEGIFSHFSTSDELDKSFTVEQNARFVEVLECLSDFSENWIKHIANSGAILYHDYYYDAVRAGISMYGIFPSLEILEHSKIQKLERALTWKTRISNLKYIEKGDSVSYGRTFFAKEKTKVATIACGYADGYFRANGKDGYVLINGKKAKIIGRVTMDQMIVDVTDIDCDINDEVVLIGESGDFEITPDLIASWTGTISYEVLTSISERVERIYI